jgi:hypothetical protein
MDAALNNGLTDAEATFLALCIHADTSWLCFESTTPSNAKPLAMSLAIADQARAASSVAVQSVPLPMNRTFAANRTNKANSPSFDFILPSFAASEAKLPTILFHWLLGQ